MLEEVEKELLPAKQKWHEIGLCLNVDKSILSSLRSSSKHKTEQKLHEVLSTYYTSSAAKPPTWATFIDCLRNSHVHQLEKLAIKIEKMMHEGASKG